MTPERLWEIKRISSPAVSPDGQSFVYGVRTYDVGANKGNTDLWLRPVAGGVPHRLTDLDGSESGAAWRPDGEWIGFLASTDGGRQWHEVRPDGSDLFQVMRSIAQADDIGMATLYAACTALMKTKMGLAYMQQAGGIINAA